MSSQIVLQSDLSLPVSRNGDCRLPDGRTMSYGLYGAAAGALVVVLDGPGSRGLGRAAAPSAEALGVTLVVPDRPGFGDSTQRRGARSRT